MASDYQPGFAFGAYVLQRRLGGGGFGDVWLAHDANGRRVALKLLLSDYAGSNSGRLRTDIELLAAAAVKDCPNVVQVLAGGIDPAPHLVMEYIEGTDLQHELARRRVFAVEEALHVAQGIATALAALEKARIVHRDIKPANVMVDGDGVIKLTDFGIAKIAGIDGTHSRSQVPLTFAYAAPEAWTGETSNLSDLYALGAVLFQCLSGRPLFVGDPMSVFQQQLSAAPDLALLPSATPPALRSLVARCLAKSLEERPQSAVEVLSMLDAAERELQRDTNPTIRLPAAFGPWLRHAPHATRPWAFHCEHETTGQPATVEVHFSDSFEYGNLLRRAVEANPRLVPLGAERLLGTSRLILRPGESLPHQPAGDFQFWVAREEQPQPTTLALVTPEMLRRAATALQSLLDSAATERIRLDLRAADLSLLPNGDVRLARPALPPYEETPAAEQAARWLRGLGLSATPGSSPSGAAPRANETPDATRAAEPTENWKPPAGPTGPLVSWPSGKIILVSALSLAAVLTIVVAALWLFQHPGRSRHVSTGAASSLSAGSGASTPLLAASQRVAISAGDDQTCALAAGGGVKCWGWNKFGELGNGTNTDSNVPVDVVGLQSGVIAVSGDDQICALTAGGGVKCWGGNLLGELGNGGDTVPAKLPVDVVGLQSGVIAVSAGFHQTCALTTGGSVKCWGGNFDGELGNGTKTDSNVPVDVVGLQSGVSAVSRTCALTAGGGVKCWGGNLYGELGNGSNTNSNVPVDVAGLQSGVIAVSAGGATCALATGGGVKCWGWNLNGELGNGSNTNSNVPVDVAGLQSGVVAVSAGGAHTCALTAGGGVKCWGGNLYGELGNGSNTDSNVPVDVAGLQGGVIAVSAGRAHTCALTAGGGVKCWGLNLYGELGNGSNTNSNVPVDVPGLVAAH